MSTIDEAIAAFRDAAQAKQRIEQELADCEERVDMLKREVGPVHARFREARTQLLEAIVAGGSNPAPGAP